MCNIAGVLYSITMLMVSLALLMAVVVTNLYLRHNQAHNLPSWLHSLFTKCSKYRSKCCPIIGQSFSLSKLISNRNQSHSQIIKNSKIKLLIHDASQNNISSDNKNSNNFTTGSSRKSFPQSVSSQLLSYWSNYERVEQRYPKYDDHRHLIDRTDADNNSETSLDNIDSYCEDNISESVCADGSLLYVNPLIEYSTSTFYNDMSPMVEEYDLVKSLDEYHSSLKCPSKNRGDIYVNPSTSANRRNSYTQMRLLADSSQFTTFTTDDNSPDINNQTNCDVIKESDIDWKDIACWVDQIFFWVFFVLSVLCFVYIYREIHVNNKRK